MRYSNHLNFCMDTIKKTLTTIPHVPGVYIYKNKKGDVIYVGKAKDLKKRVAQYFQRGDAREEKTSLLVNQIHTIKTITTDSEFDALLLEAKLIRQFLPKYNVISKDDKSPLYILITKERLPRIIWVRKTSLSDYANAFIYGPFQSVRVARTVLRQIRHIIPYCTQKQRTGKPCFYSHLGLCDPCPSAISADNVKMYRSNMRKIIAILSGKSLALIHSFERQMITYAAKNQFEEAHIFKKRIEGLKTLLARHYDPTMYIQNELFTQDIRKKEKESLQETLHIANIHRIECIDISNTSGQYSTGSLVVFIDGLPKTSDYRRFKIRTKEAPNDFAMIAEVVHRRFAHAEWPMPDVLVIDGGKGQLHAAAASPVPIIGLTKRFENIIVPIGKEWKTIRLPLEDKGLQLIIRLRDESHRFALAYHRLLRSRAFLPKI